MEPRPILRPAAKMMDSAMRAGPTLTFLDGEMVGRIERLTVGFLASAIAGVAVFVGLRGLRLPPALAAILAALVLAAGGWWLARRLPEALDGLRSRRPLLCAAWMAVSLVAVGQTVRQAAYMADPAQVHLSLLPYDDWTVHHCCLTAYAEASRLVREGVPNPYRPELYKPTPTTDRLVEGFTVDRYHYPPPFLLLPLLAQTATGGHFLDVRALWFGVTALVLLLALGVLAYRMDAPGRLRAIGLTPLIWSSLPVQMGLQMSNFQILVVSMSMLAFAAFPRRAAVGGALLAVAAVSKIFPGILGLYLVARRRWREVAWTLGFAVVFTALGLAVFGPAPFRAFVEYEMPRLSSGEAFAVPLSRPSPTARNMAPFGLPLKLAQLGVPGLGLPAGRAISLAFGVAVVALALWSARRPPRSTEEAAAIWLALLSLGTLVSPFAPGAYVLTSLIWLVCVDRDVGRPVVIAAVWLLTAIPLLSHRDVAYVPQLLLFLPAQALAIALPAVVLYRAGARALPTQERTDVPLAPVIN